MPDIQKRVFEFYGDDVVVLGLNPGGLGGNDAAYVEDYAENLGLTFPILMDTSSTYYQFVQTPAIAPFPLDVVVDASGTVRMVKRDFDMDLILQSVESALAAQ